MKLEFTKHFLSIQQHSPADGSAGGRRTPADGSAGGRRTPADGSAGGRRSPTEGGSTTRIH
jgi:hypothetical protein